MNATTGNRINIKVLRSDDEEVYRSTAMKLLLEEHQIKSESSAPYSHWQNGVAERMNRTLLGQ
jgi:transposase InsO family protein